MAIIAMTTSNSISVKPRLRFTPTQTPPLELWFTLRERVLENGLVGRGLLCQNDTPQPEAADAAEFAAAIVGAHAAELVGIPASPHNVETVR